MFGKETLLKNVGQYVCWILIFSITSINAFAQESNAVLSSRWYHPINSGDTLNTIDALKKVKAVRLDWTYCDDPNILRKYSDLGIKYSLAMNPQIPDSLGYTTAKTRIKTLKGKPYMASWMKAFGQKNPYWGCVNNPKFKKIFLDRSVELVRLQPYALMVDDALFNVQVQNEIHASLGIGCVCQYCLDGFGAYLKRKGSNIRLTSDFTTKMNSHIELLKKKELNKDAALKTANLYKEYQKESVVAFLKEWKLALLKINKNLKFLTNNYKGAWNDIYSVFDGGIAELPEQELNVANLDSLFANAKAKGKTQQFTLVSSNEFAQRYLLAYLILNKKDYLIPWDSFVPTKNNPSARYYTDLDKFQEFAKFLKQKNTVIKISGDAKSVEGNKWYKVEMDRNNNINYVILNRFPSQKKGAFNGSVIILGLLCLLGLGCFFIFRKHLLCYSLPQKAIAFFTPIKFQSVDVR